MRITMAARTTRANGQWVTTGRTSLASCGLRGSGRLLTGNEPLATGGRVRQRPPPDSLSLPGAFPACSLIPQAPVI